MTHNISIEQFCSLRRVIVKKHIISISIIFSLIPIVASAANNDIYMKIAAGVNIIEGSDLNDNSSSSNLEFGSGHALDSAIGYEFGNGMRAEVELSFSSGDIDNIGGLSTNSEANSWSLAANALYDINDFNGFKPYVGAGAGISWISYDNLSPALGSRIDDTATSPMIQGILGGDYRVNDNLSVYAQYKRIHVFDPEFRADNGNDIEAEYDSNRIMVGIKYFIGNRNNSDHNQYDAQESNESLQETLKYAETSTEIADNSKQSNNDENRYSIFFEFDSYYINNEYISLLDEVAEKINNGSKDIKIDISGHTDRSGSDGYNEELSLMRAEMVTDYLIKKGVNEENINIFGKGEYELLILTEDGVKEPKNRRVEIIYGE